mgnify:CR=1 FL=1
MPRTFAYLRVSTIGQTTDNQLREIEAAGFKVEPRRVIAETVSGSVPTAMRRGFRRLVDRLEPKDILVVTKLDRLGRNAMDVGSTVAQLAEIGVHVHCLALGGVDLASSTGKLTMNVINAVAEFERDLLVERTQAGLELVKVDAARNLLFVRGATAAQFEAQNPIGSVTAHLRDTHGHEIALAHTGYVYYHGHAGLELTERNAAQLAGRALGAGLPAEADLTHG